MPDLSVAALAEAFASGAASHVQAARAVLERIDACEPTLRAVTHRDETAARRAVAEAEARWRAVEPRGELDGAALDDLQRGRDETAGRRFDPQP